MDKPRPEDVIAEKEKGLLPSQPVLLEKIQTGVNQAIEEAAPKRNAGKLVCSCPWFI